MKNPNNGVSVSEALFQTTKTQIRGGRYICLYLNLQTRYRFRITKRCETQYSRFFVFAPFRLGYDNLPLRRHHLTATAKVIATQTGGKARRDSSKHRKIAWSLRERMCTGGKISQGKERKGRCKWGNWLESRNGRRAIMLNDKSQKPMLEYHMRYNCKNQKFHKKL